MRTSDAALLIVAVFGLSVVSALDLQRVSARTLTVYTTPALRDLLEKDLIPRFRAMGGLPIEPIYTSAGEQYNRLRLYGDDPEADFFLHASPLYVQRGYDDGYFRAINLSMPLNDTFHGASADGGVSWVAFAWTPVVEVYKPSLGSAPDLASANLKFGLPHPQLSNNGVYTVILYELVNPQAGKWGIDRTVVQPVNARTNIGGVADGTFDVTLGYEAVTQFYQKQGAKVAYGPPNFHGENVTTPVLVTAGIVRGTHEAESRRFVDFLFTNETQAHLAKFYFRSVLGPESDFASAFPPEAGVRVVHYDWSLWKGLDESLGRYEVKR